jgi:hypothetical protein
MDIEGTRGFICDKQARAKKVTTDPAKKAADKGNEGKQNKGVEGRNKVRPTIAIDGLW